jgi:hypothetical protein
MASRNLAAKEPDAARSDDCKPDAFGRAFPHRHPPSRHKAAFDLEHF